MDRPSNKIVHDDFLNWPNGLGVTPCTTEYRETMDRRDAICDVQSGGSIHDLSLDDYQEWNLLDDKLNGLHLAGHLGQGERN